VYRTDKATAKFSWLTIDLANKAVKRISIDGIPPNRKSTRFDVVVQKGRRFPPKLVISEAAARLGFSTKK